MARIRSSPRPKATPPPTMPTPTSPTPVSAPADVPLTTRTRRARRQARRSTRSSILSLPAFLISTICHLLVFYFVYLAAYGCTPGNVASPSALCPSVTCVTQPVREWFTTSPLGAKAAFAARTQYNHFLRPYASKAEASIGGKYRSSGADVWVERALVAYDARLKKHVLSTQKIVDAQLLRAKAVSCRASHSAWAFLLEKYEYINGSEFQDAVEQALAKIKVALKLKYKDAEEVIGDDAAAEDDADEEYDDDEDEDEEPITSFVTSTVTVTLSRAVSTTSTSTITKTSIPPSSSALTTPSGAVLTEPVATPEVTPLAKELTPEEEAHDLAILDDLQAWTLKFRQAGKSAISTLSSDLEGLFSDAKIALVIAEFNKNLTAIAVPETLADLEAEATKLQLAVTKTVADISKEAERIRNETLEIFKTVVNYGLSEVGRKWAIKDDTTWEDWKELHALRELTDDFAKVIGQIPVTNTSLEVLRTTIASDVEKWVTQAAKALDDAAAETRTNDEITEEATSEPEAAPPAHDEL
ncbi:uncharacterized protein V1518DRAFT_414626 [Limtongia smithiae]|uniref:uncharacterized protein n=1 Tax=Limtongia smithiae TaxID=1125753 RepID=UPI0034CDD168